MGLLHCAYKEQVAEQIILGVRRKAEELAPLVQRYCGAEVQNAAKVNEEKLTNCRDLQVGEKDGGAVGRAFRHGGRTREGDK